MGPVYNRFIEIMPSGLDVVEVGAWLGAGTYELASAMKEHGHTKSSLHVYDWFIADRNGASKAAGHYRYPKGINVDMLGKPLKIKPGQDTLPIVRNFLHGFPFVKFYKGEIDRMAYTGKPIGILVVDAAKKKKHFDHLMGKIEKHLAPGAVVFFMDYWYHLYLKGAGTECQAAYLKKSGRYEHIETYKNLCVEVVRFNG